MPLLEVVVPLTDSDSIARTGQTHNWDTPTSPDASKDDDGASQYFAGGTLPIPGQDVKMAHLKRYGFTTPAAALRYPLLALKIRTSCFGGGPTSDPGTPTNDTLVYADSICLVKSGTILTANDKGDEVDQYLGVYEWRDYKYTLGELSALGIDRNLLLSSPNDFGAAIGMKSYDSDAVMNNYNRVNQIALVFVLLVDEECMDHYRAGQGNGWEVAFKEALPAAATSTQIFANCPDGCTLIELTVATDDLTIKWNEADDTDAAVAGQGSLYSAGATWKLHGNTSSFKAARGIKAATSTPTGWITYWKNS